MARGLEHTVNRLPPTREPGALCSFMLRLPDGRFLSDPSGTSATYSTFDAQLWLWPLNESDQERAARAAAIGRLAARHLSGTGRLVPVRARP